MLVELVGVTLETRKKGIWEGDVEKGLGDDEELDSGWSGGDWE